MEMGELIDDDMLNTFAIVAEPEGVAPSSTAATATSSSASASTFYAPYASDPDRWQDILDALKAA